MKDLTTEAARAKMIEAWENYCWWQLCNKMFALLAGKETTFEKAFRTVYLSEKDKFVVINDVSLLLEHSYQGTRDLQTIVNEYQAMREHPSHDTWLLSMGFKRV